MNAFVGDDGHLRSGWRFVIYFLAAFAAIVILFAVIGVAVTLASGPTGAEQLLKGRYGILIQGIVLTLGSFLIGWGCVALLEKLRAASLGWALHVGWWKDLLIGSILGILTVTIAAVLAGAIGGFKIALSPSMSGAVKSTLISLGLFVLAAAGEEGLFRGYGLQTMSRAKLAWLGIVLTSVPFGIVHLGNPSANIWSTSNTVLAGVWLGLAYMKTRSLWFPLGLHWSWNWTMGALYGIPVSGTTNVTPEPVMHVTYGGPVWLHGGAYGLEGGLACTIAVLVSCLVIWRVGFLRPSQEMLNASPEAYQEPGEWDDPNRSVI
ncbi:MAG: lysostaphin resistance A-like protein [Pyrinomonadaceae bacterium]